MRVAESIRERLAAATPGPWTADTDDRDDTPVGITSATEDIVSTGYNDWGPCGGCYNQDNADLIAHAPTDLVLLLAAAEALNGMLAAFDPGDHRHGPDELYPCGKCAYDIAVTAKRDLEADR